MATGWAQEHTYIDTILSEIESATLREASNTPFTHAVRQRIGGLLCLSTLPGAIVVLNGNEPDLLVDRLHWSTQLSVCLLSPVVSFALLRSGHLRQQKGE